MALRGALLSATVLVLAACGGGARPGEERPLSVGVTGSPSTLNDVLSSGVNLERELIELLFLTLLEPKPDFGTGPPSYGPRLAESWQLSEDGLELTFFLRADASWSDGVRVTAHDVRFTWQAQISEETGWAYSDLKRHIADVQVVDEHTVRFVFAERSSTQLADAAEGAILPRHAWGELPFGRWRQEPTWFAEHMVTSGPYRVARWQPGLPLVLARNDRYHDPSLPRIGRVQTIDAHDEGALLRMLEAGDVDFIWSLRHRDTDRIEANPALRVISYPTRQYNFLAWNLRRPWFESAQVRRALALAVDRQAIVDTVLGGRGRVATSVVPSSLWAHDRSLEPLPYDPAAARGLLEGAGWIDRDGDGWLDRAGVAFRFELITNAGSDVRWEALEMIREDLRELGIEATARRLEPGVAVAAMKGHDFDAALTGLSADTSLDLSFVLHSDAIDNGQFNFSAYSDPEVDALIESIQQADGPGEAAELARRIQQIVHRDQPMLFLWEPLGMTAASAALLGVAPTGVSVFASMPYWSWAAADTGRAAATSGSAPVATPERSTADR
ncbi:MAG TPA: ABC transporter substrate-binding protein [Thermoanaerobaculia bacterium]|nr:ABC transporter substrate-binding protein [Thermoanaerobaculia bacterium]